MISVWEFNSGFWGVDMEIGKSIILSDRSGEFESSTAVTALKVS